MSLINVEYPSTLGQQQAGPQAPPKTDSYNLDVIDLVKRKFWIILFFVLLGTAATMLYFFKAPKTYESTAQIFVDEKSASVISSGDGDSFVSDSSIEKYLVTLKSTRIIQPAMDAGKFHELDTFRECDDILRTLREEDILTATPSDAKSDSGVIKLSFRGPDLEECKLILDRLIESFDAHIRSTTKNIGGETADLVVQIHDDVAKQLNETEAEIKRLKGLPGILISADGRVVDPQQMQLTKLHEDLHILRRERIMVEARAENIRADQAAGHNMDDLVAEILREQSDVNATNGSGGAYSTTHSKLVELRIDQEELENQFGPDHPDVRKIVKQIQMVEAMKEREATAMTTSNRNSDIVTDFLKQMSQQVAIISSQERSLKATIEAEQANAGMISAVVENLAGLERKRERLETAYNTILERLSEIKAYKEHLWRNLQEIDPPSIGEQVAPSFPISLAAGLFLGSLMGLLFAMVKDMAEKTFRSSDDVAAMLNSRVIGHVSMFQKSRNKRNAQYPDVQPEVVTMHTPASQASESYRAMRTSIFFRSQETGAKVVQITSPTPGDGKSTTISNLAASIAQSGRRVLLIDADMRKPVQHKLFGATNDYGLSSVVSGEMDPLEAVQIIQPEYFSIVTSGPIPSNPAELLTSARFAAILDVYRNEFDFVLIDTPPMLAVTDPSIICGHADVLYMVMRIRNGVRTSATRAKEMIDAMGIEMGGIIINGLRRRDQKTYNYSGQYGYGSYKYGSGPSTTTPRRSGPPSPPKGRLTPRANVGNETRV